MRLEYKGWNIRAYRVGVMGAFVADAGKDGRENIGTRRMQGKGAKELAVETIKAMIDEIEAKAEAAQ